jgi:tRNA pseudouridine38-40 synthase
MRYFISLSYKGTSYCGWQVQVNQPSVQAELERAFSIYFANETGITGAGRTDTGVHALNYIAHFDSVNPILIQDYPKLIYKINAILPSDITLLDICHVADDAHARFDAISRTYKYFIHTKKDSFLDEYSYFFPYDIDVAKMNLAANFLLGVRDFTSMAKLHSDVKTNICTVSQAYWAPESPLNFSSDDISNSSFCFTITANRFLRNMVRAVVGSLLEVGRGKQESAWIEEILEQKNRCAAGNSVPAHPLFLMKIEYPYKILL